MDSNFNSGGFDPSKVNRSGLDQNKQNKNDDLPEQSQTEEQTPQQSRFTEKNADEILNFMAANSAMNVGKVQQSSIDDKVAQFTSLITPEHYDDMFSKFRKAVDEELQQLGRNLSEDARNELAELSLSNHLIGTPMVLEA